MYTANSWWGRAEIAVHTGDFPRAHAHLARLAEGIASGHIPARLSPFHQLGEGNLARLEGRMEVASACFREVLASEMATNNPGLTQRALVGLAMMDGFAGPGGTARELLARARALDPHGKELVSPLPVIIAAVAELVVSTQPATAILIGAMASRLGERAWFRPMYGQDVARITAILDRARDEHGIPVPDVPADLTASDATSQCLEALAALEMIS